jgi:RNA polymerase sigma-70 factor (sigma-E family)
LGEVERERVVSGAIEVGESREAEAGLGAPNFDAAFPELFRAAYRVAYRLTRSREDADDCAQEACARAYTDWKKLNRRGDVTPWVVRVSGNLAIDRWRKTTRNRALPASAEATSAPADRVDLAHALDGLPRRQREVVVLRYIADLSEATVASALGCSVGTVKTHASRGLAALRRVLADDEEVSS